ncbi:MAG: DHH family phosphoesterase [Clostridiales bacterium]|nr:DHH family phosphoesterase [Clostridiales bacterium]
MAIEIKNIDETKVKEFIGLIKNHKEIFIMGHKNPDADCFGAAVSILDFINSYNNNSKIILNHVSRNIKNIYKYINLKEKFITKNKDIDIKSIDNFLLVIVDTNRESLVENRIILKKSKATVIFDHHEEYFDSIKKAIIRFQDVDNSSTCEIITEICFRNKKIKKKIANLLLAGITVDSKNFSMNTTSITHEIASFLILNKANPLTIKKLFQQNLNKYKEKLDSMNKLKIIKKSIAIMTTEDSSLVAILSDELLNIKNIETSFVICLLKKKIIISARSLGSIDTQKIMQKFNGGGHINSSAAQVKSDNPKKIITLLKKAIRENS